VEVSLPACWFLCWSGPVPEASFWFGAHIYALVLPFVITVGVVAPTAIVLPESDAAR
jgi:hypothetical protein